MTIEIDARLMRAALRATGAQSPSDVVELGLRTLLRLRRQEEIRRWRGKFEWRGDPEAMRADR
jgi:Arc/MetJ family transcription regulator